MYKDQEPIELNRDKVNDIILGLPLRDDQYTPPSVNDLNALYLWSVYENAELKRQIEYLEEELETIKTFLKSK